MKQLSKSEMALSREKEIKREDLIEYLTDKHVVDMKMLPDHEMKTILVRVVIYPNDVKERLSPE